MSLLRRRVVAVAMHRISGIIRWSLRTADGFGRVVRRPCHVGAGLMLSAAGVSPIEGKLSPVLQFSRTLQGVFFLPRLQKWVYILQRYVSRASFFSCLMTLTDCLRYHLGTQPKLKPLDLSVHIALPLS
ncbi:uncharacterized protein K489DRAFT_251690 [Dissoconium aciculare CBS 342.82]|uniref:Uncharacterized protein n=1 Tax=Dissoconium aciculare CBS 342.82 TaxID=1314786 RepID=A0A6J3M278_9PEZI|nr:uncharacterized protein K489DRAFT_251690 [Dissoconium aciculare CBS 342.82]KAF1821599.1 hypothetical protein K489DRAFT_251690 [Dissoconium aciculare CBS 342.82]